MKKALALLLLVATAAAFSQNRSDYEVVKRFESQYKAVLASIKQVKTVMDCADVSATIDDIERTFKADKALIDKVYYDDGFEEKILEARVQLRLSQEKLGVIETQVQQIAALETQVRELSGKIAKLDKDNAKLLNDIQRLSENVKRLSKESGAEFTPYDSLKAVVAQLQRALNERDQMIFALVDSVFLQYDKNVEALHETEKKSLVAKMQRNDVFASVKKSIRDNALFLEATNLTAGDVASITREQRRFAQQWRGIAPKLASLYLSSKEKTRELTTIDTMLAYWQAQVDVAYWRSFNAVMKDRGVPLPEFNSGEQFHKLLLAYIESETANAAKQEYAVRLDRYTHFVDSLWKADVGYVWVSLLMGDGRLTDVQKKQLDQKIDEWKQSIVPPIQPTPMYYYIIGGLLAILLLGVLIRLFSRRT